MAGPTDRQGPTSGVVSNDYGSLCHIVEHPAFRIGFLDAQNGRPFDHDGIMRRIVEETPPRALERISWPWAATDDADDTGAPDLLGFGERVAKNRRAAVELAQYRYEEGRLAVIDLGLKCKAWGHPDYPPRAVQDYIWQRAKEALAAYDPQPPPQPPCSLNPRSRAHHPTRPAMSILDTERQRSKPIALGTNALRHNVGFYMLTKELSEAKRDEFAAVLTRCISAEFRRIGIINELGLTAMKQEAEERKNNA